MIDGNNVIKLYWYLPEILSVAISPSVVTLEFPRTGNRGLKRSLFLFGGDVDAG